MLHFPPPDSSRPPSLHYLTIIFADMHVILSFAFASQFSTRPFDIHYQTTSHIGQSFPKMLGTWPIMWTKYCVEGVFIVKPNVLTLIALSHPWRSIMCYSIHYPLSTIHHPLSSTLHPGNSSPFPESILQDTYKYSIVSSAYHLYALSPSTCFAFIVIITR